MAKPQKIRVVVADDHAILRAGLRMLINAQADMTVVAEAQDGIEAVAAIQHTKPDVAILDVTMPRSGGLDAIHEIVSQEPIDPHFAAHHARGAGIFTNCLVRWGFRLCVEKER